MHLRPACTKIHISRTPTLLNQHSPTVGQNAAAFTRRAASTFYVIPDDRALLSIIPFFSELESCLRRVCWRGLSFIHPFLWNLSRPDVSSAGQDFIPCSPKLFILLKIRAIELDRSQASFPNVNRHGVCVYRYMFVRRKKCFARARRSTGTEENTFDSDGQRSFEAESFTKSDWAQDGHARHA